MNQIAKKDITDARWVYACQSCEWIGNNPGINFFNGYCDCPECGNSCSSDEPTFEPRAGTGDGSLAGFEPTPEQLRAFANYKRGGMWEEKQKQRLAKPWAAYAKASP
jgi:hypothetical protein